VDFAVFVGSSNSCVHGLSLDLNVNSCAGDFSAKYHTFGQW